MRGIETPGRGLGSPVLDWWRGRAAARAVPARAIENFEGVHALVSNAAYNHKVSPFAHGQIGNTVTLLSDLVRKRRNLLSHLVVYADGGLYFGVVPIYVHMDTSILVIERKALPVHIIVGSITYPIGDGLG